MSAGSDNSDSISNFIVWAWKLHTNHHSLIVLTTEIHVKKTNS